MSKLLMSGLRVPCYNVKAWKSPEQFRVTLARLRVKKVSVEMATSINPLTSNAIEPLRDVDSLHLQHGAASPGRLQRLAPKSEEIRRKLVTTALDFEVDGLVHQARLVERNDAIAVGVEANLISGCDSTRGTPRPVSSSTTVIVK
jgi:hypothetical protein